MDGDDVRAGEQAEQRHTSRDYFFSKIDHAPSVVVLKSFVKKKLAVL
jgi:hypothetical protein